MKTNLLGHVLGISKQRQWWNRQTSRRSTEEMAATRIDQSIRPGKNQSGTKRDKRQNPGPKWKPDHTGKLPSIVKQVALHGHKVRCRGVVAYVHVRADILKKSKLRLGSAGVRKLGKFASEQVAQVTVHTQDPTRPPGKKHSFTFFVSEVLVKRLNVRPGMRVRAELHGFSDNPSHPIWLCKRLNRHIH